MDTVILKQFEEYLQSRGIKAQTQSNANGHQTSTRIKRSTEPRILETLSKQEVYKFVIHMFSPFPLLIYELLMSNQTVIALLFSL